MRCDCGVVRMRNYVEEVFVEPRLVGMVVMVSMCCARPFLASNESLIYTVPIPCAFNQINIDRIMF